MLIKELYLATLETDKLVSFYGSLPGLKIIEQNDRTLRFQCGSSNITFALSQHEINPVYHFAFNVHPSYFRSLIDLLRKNLKINFERFNGEAIIAFPNWSAQSVYFRDPAGNILEYISRDRLSTHDSAIPIMSVSEIGLATENVGQLSNLLIENTGIAIFDPGHSKFIALGDDNGLMVISSINRNWFPTEIEVQSPPLRIIVEQGGIDYKIEGANCLYKINQNIT